jgi:hypothetical protein
MSGGEPPKSIASVLASADEMLRNVQFGLEAVEHQDARRRMPGFHNVVVFGRAVTNMLQGLRHIATGFDAWYDPLVGEMTADPLLRYLYRLRSDILKKGVMPPTERTIHITHFDGSMIPRPAPAGALGFFVGDANGGSGWDVQLPDGSREVFYVELAEGTLLTYMTLPDAPRDHLGGQLKDQQIATIARAYFEYLRRMVREARARFGSTSD